MGLHSAYQHQTNLRSYMKELMSVSNLPAPQIPRAFANLKLRCPATESASRLRVLLRYFEDNWVLSDKVPPKNWSTYKRAIRTNNDCEGWHNRLNDALPSEHPNIYLLIKELAKETSLLPLQIRLVATNNLTRRTGKEASARQEAMFHLWDQYDNREISATAFLRECAKLNKYV